MGYINIFFDRYSRTIIIVAVIWWLLNLIRLRPTNAAELVGSVVGSAFFAILLVGVYAGARGAIYYFNEE